MTVETFTWRIERELDITSEYRVVEAQFGDGYKQTSADGINTKDESYVIKVHAKQAEAVKIKEFFDRHAGWKSFLWTPPLGSLSLFRCKNPKPKYEGGGLWSFTGTFEKSYSSMS